MDSSCDMPNHLLFDILLWLPVTILLRLKSVCKSWCTLIDSPIFIAKHFEHNRGNDNLLGIWTDDVFSGRWKSCLLSGNKYEVYNNFDCGQPWHFVRETMETFSSNGIICLVHNNYEDVALWNPAVKQLRSIPKTPAPWEDYYCSVFGFGFNVKSNDHNFIRIAVCKENMSNTLVEVYSLKADSWICMHKDFAIPLRFHNSKTYHITKNGTCFWVAFRWIPDLDGYDIRDNVILSFNLNEETFETMPLPLAVREVSYSAAIDFLGDKLAYIHGVDHRQFMNGPSYYEIWVLHEYGVKESWNKVWKIGPTDIPGTDEVLFPSCFIKNGEFLLLTTFRQRKKAGELSLYNLGSEENHYLELQEPNISFQWWTTYTESLVPVKRVNDEY